MKLNGTRFLNAICIMLCDDEVVCFMNYRFISTTEMSYFSWNRNISRCSTLANKIYGFCATAKQRAMNSHTSVTVSVPVTTWSMAVKVARSAPRLQTVRPICVLIYAIVVVTIVYPNCATGERLEFHFQPQPGFSLKRILSNWHKFAKLNFRIIVQWLFAKNVVLIEMKNEEFDLLSWKWQPRIGHYLHQIYRLLLELTIRQITDEKLWRIIASRLGRYLWDARFQKVRYAPRPGRFITRRWLGDACS